MDATPSPLRGILTFFKALITIGAAMAIGLSATPSISTAAASSRATSRPATLATGFPQAAGGYQLSHASEPVDAPEATQAAAADATSVYAVSDTQVVRYDRATGRELARSTGPAEHLNSAFLWDGNVYCAHSNFPHKPDRCEIRRLDPADMKLTIFHAFADPPGSLTWAVRKGESWWCHFAWYGKDNGRSVLVRYGADWKETGRWAYPPALVADWGKYSLSGGVWDGETLLATGHDKPTLYRLQVPAAADGTITVVETMPVPFPGQGIAIDPTSGDLVGIDRAHRRVLFATYAKK